MNDEIIEELKMLFAFCPPEKLRQRITFLYFQYLQGDAVTVKEKSDFKDLAEDVYFLIRFLEIAEMPEVIKEL